MNIDTNGEGSFYVIKSKRVCLSSTKKYGKHKKKIKKILRLPYIFWVCKVSRSAGTKVPKNMNDDEGHITLNIMQYRENGNISKRYVLCLVFVSPYIYVIFKYRICIDNYHKKKPFYPITHSRPLLQFGIMNKCNLPFFSFNIIWGFVVFVCWQKFVCLKNIKLIQIGKFICQSHCFTV